jgi:hypothetical protein
MVTSLCASLNAATNPTIRKSLATEPQVMLELLGYFQSGRALLLLRWLAIDNPTSATALLAAAQNPDDDFGRLLLDRFMVIEKTYLLSRIFGAKRTAMLIEIIDGLNRAGS